MWLWCCVVAVWPPSQAVTLACAASEIVTVMAMHDRVLQCSAIVPNVMLPWTQQRGRSVQLVRHMQGDNLVCDAGICVEGALHPSLRPSPALSLALSPALSAALRPALSPAPSPARRPSPEPSPEPSALRLRRSQALSLRLSQP